MNMKKAEIDITTVTKVAQLARLHLEQNELESIAMQLNRVLENFEQLSEVNTEGVEPMVTPTPIELVLREDVVQESIDREAVMSNAPARAGALYKVPPVV